jgi:antirestriction protein ArdC
MINALNHRDIYQAVTDRIVAALEQGTVPWLRPWRDDKSGSALEPYNAATGRPSVFNVAQCDDIPADKLKRPVAPCAGETDMNAIATRAGATVRHGGPRAFYATSGDFVQVRGIRGSRGRGNRRIIYTSANL